MNPPPAAGPPSLVIFKIWSESGQPIELVALRAANGLRIAGHSTVQDEATKRSHQCFWFVYALARAMTVPELQRGKTDLRWKAYITCTCSSVALYREQLKYRFSISSLRFVRTSRRQ